MARNKRNGSQVFSVEAVREAGLALMALIHPLCELRVEKDGEDAICTVVTQDRRSMLMASVADRAAEAVIPNNGTPHDLFHGLENLATSLDMAAALVGSEDGATLEAVVLVDSVTEAVAALFRRENYRAALSAMARRLDRGAKPSMGEITKLVGPHLPKLDQMKWDVGSIYIRMGWVAN